ncbi:MAG: hypothetical protein AAF208_06800 [Cyanobacteria bacterium P01_A01_bin.45]
MSIRNDDIVLPTCQRSPHIPSFNQVRISCNHNNNGAERYQSSILFLAITT